MKAFLLAGLASLTCPAPHLAPYLALRLVSSIVAPADELKRERLPADIDFVVHFDLEGFKQTELWKRISEGAKRAEIEAEFDELNEIKTRFGIDPFQDVRAVTLYKVEHEEDPTVVLFSTNAQIDAALKKFQAEPGYEKVRASGVELHTWKEDEGDSVFAYVHSPSATERVVVLSSNQASALHAARVLRGEDPNHATAGTLLEVTPAKGSFLYLAAAHIPHLDEFRPASQVFGLAQGLQVDFGEAGGLLHGHMGVNTGSPRDAFDISNVVNGLLSLARLAGDEAGDLLELLSGLRLSTLGNQVVVDFEYGVGRLMEILESLDDDGDSEADDGF